MGDEIYAETERSEVGISRDHDSRLWPSVGV